MSVNFVTRKLKTQSLGTDEEDSSNIDQAVSYIKICKRYFKSCFFCTM